MYIGFTMTLGTNATEIRSSVTWYYALALRLENLPEMYPASSKPSYDGHGELNKHCVPACPVLVTHYCQVAVQPTEESPALQHHILPATAYHDGYLWGRGINRTYAASVRAARGKSGSLPS